MPVRQQTFFGGINTDDLDKVQLRWNGMLPIPRDDASPRQVLDFAAIVGLDSSENSVQLPRLEERALAAYEALYGVAPLARRD